jgi:SAM-dependent methyltransferase
MRFQTLILVIYAFFPKDYVASAFIGQRSASLRSTSTPPLHIFSFLSSLKEPDEKESKFGRQTYWNECYEKEREFSWYAEWKDIQPFFTELVPLNHEQPPPRVLLPGIGNDRSMVDMYDHGYTQMSAFDYAAEGVECAKEFFADRDCDLLLADCRNLSYENDSFDAILEKGTLDAVYLSGAHDKELAAEYLAMAVSEMARVVRKGGVVMSITAACADAVQEAFEKCGKWRVLRDGGFYATDDGFTSNNIDATIFAWERT